MFIQEKLNEGVDFRAYLMKHNGKDIIIKLKPVSYLTLEKGAELLSAKDITIKEIITLVKVFVYNLTDETIESITKDQVAFNKLVELIFITDNINNGFQAKLIERSERIIKGSNSLYYKFVSFLLSVNYKILELENLSQQRVVDLAIKELTYRGIDLFVDFFQGECADEAGNPIESREELFEYLQKLKETYNLEPQVATRSAEPSAFDQLSGL